MLLSEPQRTNYDVHFRLFGVPVRVHPFFWLLTAILGWGYMDRDKGLLLLALFIGSVFVSVLLHEMGHVVMFRLCGCRSHVVLYAMGGMAIPDGEPPSRWQRVLVALAGPAAGLALAAAAYGAISALPFLTIEIDLTLIVFVLAILFLWNLIINLINLLPIYPLDGGRVAREFFCWLMPRRGVEISLGISFLMASLIAVLWIAGELNKTVAQRLPIQGGLLGGFFFAMMAVENFQRLQQAQEFRKRWDRDEWWGK